MQHSLSNLSDPVTALLWLYWLGSLAAFVYFVFIRRHVRRKPDGYVGRFRQPDGRVVHVARVEGQLMVISEEPPGVLPKNLGNVSGRELLRWHKLSSTPDGQDCVARPD